MFNNQKISITSSQAQEIIMMNNEEALKVISVLTQNSIKYLEELLETPIKELNDLKEFIDVFGFNFSILMNFLNRINKNNIEDLACFLELSEILGLDIRICDKCDSFMAEGYHMDGDYYCSNECLYEDFSKEEAAYLLKVEDEYNYYTDWTEGENSKFNTNNINYYQLYKTEINSIYNSQSNLNYNEFNVLKSLLFGRRNGQKKLFFETIKNSTVYKKLFDDYSKGCLKAKEEIDKFNLNLNSLGLIDDETKINSINDLEELYIISKPEECLSEEIFEDSIYSFIDKRLDNLDILNELMLKVKNISVFWDIIYANFKIFKKDSYHQKIIDIVLINLL